MMQLVLPFDLPGIDLVPTISMERATTRLVQCASCGVAMAVPDGYLSERRHDDPLGPCPRCGCPDWWNQDGSSLGPFKRSRPA